MKANGDKITLSKILVDTFNNYDKSLKELVNAYTDSPNIPENISKLNPNNACYGMLLCEALQGGELPAKHIKALVG